MGQWWWWRRGATSEAKGIYIWKYFNESVRGWTTFKTSSWLPKTTDPVVIRKIIQSDPRQRKIKLTISSLLSFAYLLIYNESQRSFRVQYILFTIMPARVRRLRQEANQRTRLLHLPSSVIIGEFKSDLF